jgi:hypothetical protein
MRTGGITGEIIPWRDVLHEGPVPPDLSLDKLSRKRAEWLASQGLGTLDEVSRQFQERDDFLRRYTDYDEVVLWFEWDLYDQLQLIQILDFLAESTEEERLETGTRLSLVSLEGYLGNLDPDLFAGLLLSRQSLTDDALQAGRRAWTAFRSSDPRELEKVARGGNPLLQFLDLTLWRHLEELPSMRNGLSRSESQILEAIAQGPLVFHEIFKRVAHREERIFCGDAIMALYIERMSLAEEPLISYTSGDRVDAPRTAEDSRAFRNAEMALTAVGSEVLRCDRDWITMGGSDRWLGGAHLDGPRTQWRWNTDSRTVVQAG